MHDEIGRARFEPKKEEKINADKKTRAILQYYKTVIHANMYRKRNVVIQPCF